MAETLRYAFIDESGTVGADSGTHFLVVAVLSADEPREIAAPVRRALKKFGPSLTFGEIKAADFKESAILRLLQELARQEIEIVAVVVNQQVIKKLPREKETVYRFTVTRTVQHLVERFPRLEIIIDKRYTHSEMR